ncbi:MAG: S8 family serine peptidase [Candidatus Methanoperedens sp.]|nr:S8 family serine peptidase [Candidatus Methanoperedens sp.]
MEKFISKIFLVLVLISLFSIVSEAAEEKISPDLKSRILNNESVPVIILFKDQPALRSKENAVEELKKHASGRQQDIAALLKEGKKKGRADRIKQLWVVNAVAVKASPELIEKLSRQEDVAAIVPDQQLHILEYSQAGVQIDTATGEIKHINTTRVWELGINGTGINVSVLDTGLDYNHPDIAERYIRGYDFVNNDTDPMDDYGHGTHVAGTAGGDGRSGTTTGVAPGVNLFAAKVCDSHGLCFVSDIVSGIQWSVENNASIISLSLGGPRDPIITAAVNNAVSSGVVVIAAAGNSGPSAGTISFPAGEKNVIAVGAVDNLDNIAAFSSRGPLNVDGETLIKPDISAPGVSITSLNYLTGGYINMSGTSMATPHVSGAAALILEAAKRLGKTLSPGQIKNILETSSLDLGAAGKDSTYGTGRIDVFAAVRSLDPDPPLVAANQIIYAGGNPAAKNGDNIVFNVTITDAGFGIKNASIDISPVNSSMRDISLNNVSGFWKNNTIVNASDGIYLLNITAYDNVSNVNNTVQLAVNVDNTPPAVIAKIDYTSGNTAARNGSIIIFNATINDAVTGVKNASVSASGLNTSLSDVFLSRTSGFWTNSVLVNTSDGTYHLNVTAYDNMGYVNDSVQLSVIVDNTPPLIYEKRLDYQHGNAANLGSIIEFNISALDPVVNGTSAGLKNILVDASQMNNSGWIMLSNQSGFWKGNATFDKFKEDGNYTLNITLSDNAGNENDSEKLDISLDSTPPSVTEVNVSQQFINLNGSANITARVKDPGGEVNTGEIFVLVTYPDSTLITYPMSSAGEGVFYYNFTDTWQYGRFSAAVLANDTAGNTNTSQKVHFATTFMTVNTSVETGENKETIVSAPLSNTTLHLFTGSISNGSVNITQSKVNITSNELGPGIYVLINVSESIKNNLSYVIIAVNYSDGEVSSLVESSLRLHRWNITSRTWDRLLGAGSFTYVNDAGVDTVNNFVWANLTTLSEFAISGDLYSPPSQQPQVSGGGGGGGGGGGTSGENYSNIEVKEKHDLHIFKDRSTSYRFTNYSNPVMYVNITGNVSAGEISTMVEVLRNTSSLVSTPAPGKVYRDLNIWVGTSGFARPRNIKNAEVIFRVRKEWATDPDSISLYLYDSGWTKLPTKRLNEDLEFHYYLASTDRFSHFAISAETTSEGQVSEKRSVFTEAFTSNETQVEKPPTKQNVPLLTGPAIVQIIAVIILAGKKIRNKRL